MCGAAVPAATTMKVACATRATESSVRTFSMTSLAMRVTHHVGDVLARGERDVVVGVQAQRHDGQVAAVTPRVREMLAALGHQVVRRSACR